MNWGLPTSVEIDGTDCEIRSDFRAILDICTALNDPELNDQEKSLTVLEIFYPALECIPTDRYEEAIRKCFWFINCGEEPENRKKPRLVDWEQDYSLIISPVNKVLGQEARAIPYNHKENTGGLHWWTFVGAYQEIGDCTFAQVVRIRDHLARGKTLDKSDREWYRRNRDLVDLKTTYTEAEQEILQAWSGV